MLERNLAILATSYTQIFWRFLKKYEELITKLNYASGETPTYPTKSTKNKSGPNQSKPTNQIVQNVIYQRGAKTKKSYCQENPLSKGLLILCKRVQGQHQIELTGHADFVRKLAFIRQKGVTCILPTNRGKIGL